MPRLTRDMRDEIVRKVLYYKFHEEEKALTADGHKVFDAVIDVVQGKHKASIAALPLEYFHTTMSFRVRVPSKVRNRGDHTVNIYGAHPRPAPNNSRYSNYNDLKESEVPPAVYKAAQEHAERVLDQKERCSELRSKLEALVNSVTTTKRLYEVWPELSTIAPEPILPKERGASGTTALTINVAELNRTIPLPPPAKKAKKP